MPYGDFEDRQLKMLSGTYVLHVRDINRPCSLIVLLQKECVAVDLGEGSPRCWVYQSVSSFYEGSVHVDPYVDNW